MPPPEHLEPAKRDPKRLRRTAFALVGIMILGGILVLTAYEKFADTKVDDTRPAIIHRITKERDLRVIRQDGQTADLFDLRGKVVAIHVLDSTSPATSGISNRVMHRLSEKHAANPDFALVTLVVNPLPAEHAATNLKSIASQHAIELPQWWLATNEPKTLHKFIKNELKATTFPHPSDAGWQFDTSIYLLDKQGHLRRAVIPQKNGGTPYVSPFDFDQAANWDNQGTKTGTGKSNVEQLEIILTETIDTLLAESATTP